MSKKEFDAFLAQERREVEEIMHEIEAASKRFDDIVRDIRQHC